MAESLGTAELELRADGSGLDRDMNRAHQSAAAKLDAAGTKMMRTGGTLTKAVTGPILAMGTAIAVTGANFQTAMSKIEGLVGISKSEVDKLGQSVLALAPKVGKGPAELSDALFTVTSAGFRGAEAMDVLEQAAMASAAGLGDTRSIAEAATGVINAYGSEVIDAARATEIVTATARAGNFATEDLAGALGRVTPFAEAAGASFEDVGGAIAILTRVNNDARESVTQTASLMRAFSAPTKQTQQALDELGLSTDQVREHMSEKGLAGTLQMLDERLGGNRDALREVIPDSQGFSAALTILNADAETLDSTFGAVTDSAGITEEAFGAAADTARFKFNQAMAQVQKLMIQLSAEVLPYASQALEKVTEGVRRAAEWWGTLDGRTKKIVVAFIGLVAAAGPVLMIAGLLTKAVALLAAGVGLLASPVVLVVAALAALAAGLVYAYQRSAAFRQIVDQVWAWIQQAVPKAIAVVRLAIATFVEWARGAWDRWGADIVAIARDAWEIISITIKKIIEGIRATIAAWTRVITGIWNKWGAGIVRFARETWNNIAQVIDGVINVIRGVIQTVLALIRGDWSGAWQGIKRILAGVWDAIQGVVRQALNMMRSIVQASMSALDGLWRRVWAKMRQVLVDAWGAIKTAVSRAVGDVVDRVRGLKNDVIGFFSGAGTWLLEAGKNIIRGLINGISSMIPDVGSAVSSAVSAVTDRLPWSPAKTGPLRTHPPEEGGANVAALFADGLASKIPDVASQIGTMVDLNAAMPTRARFDALVPAGTGDSRLLRRIAEAVESGQADWDRVARTFAREAAREQQLRVRTA